jgi:hypothetical protein
VALGVTGVCELANEAAADTSSIGDALEWDAANNRIAAFDAGQRIGVDASGGAAAVVRVSLDG